MNQQERHALQDFIQELARARLERKDPEAEAMIRRAVANLPDAPYLLVQRVLLQEQALDAAHRQIATLRRRLDAALPQRSSFPDPVSDWGHSEFRSHPAHARQPHGDAYRHGEPRGYYEVPAGRPGLMSGGMGSFLGSMAGAAAGLAAGSFLYHGIDDLLHHDRGEGAGGQGTADMPGDLANDAGWSDDGGMGDGGGDGGGD